MVEEDGVEDDEEVVVVTTLVIAGAHTSFELFGVTPCKPNWSFARIDGNPAFGHLTL
jgi:hypothetical protein